MKITKNFSLNEFDCRDGTKVPYELIPNVVRLADCLQVIRDEINDPIHITSGYRTPSHNTRVGGGEQSQHLRGTAADIIARDHTPNEMFNVIERLISEGRIKQGGLAVYKGFVHYDIRGTRARW